MYLKPLLFFLFCLCLTTPFYYEISIFLFFILFIRFINNIGKKLLLIETISLYSCLIYLIIPILGYKYYTISNPLSGLWGTYMKVPEGVYFEYTLPAILLFIFALLLFEKKMEGEIVRRVLNNAQEQLKHIGQAPYYIVLAGLLAFYITSYAPVSLTYILTIVYLCVFAGIAYLLFNNVINFKGKLVITFFTLWILYNAVLSTMFTIVVYMGISFFGLLMLNRKFTFFKKIAGLTLLIGLTLVLQFSKSNFRMLIKRNLIQGSPLTTFATIYFKNLTNIKEVFSINSFFPIYFRTNQGYQLAAVMHYIPAYKAHDKGDFLSKSIFASFIPRAIWPNKPGAGGKMNMKYYANIFLDTTSMNVGPIGEGYGAFGKWGGILYMFLFGSFLSLAYRYFIHLAVNRPLLLFWQPLIFYEVIFCMENDTMQALNSLIKITFFLFVLFKFFPNLIIPRSGIIATNHATTGI